MKIIKEINAAPEVLVTVNLALQVFWLSAVHCTNSNFDANFFVYYNWIDRRLRLVSNLFEKPLEWFYCKNWVIGWIENQIGPLDQKNSLWIIDYDAILVAVITFYYRECIQSLFIYYIWYVCSRVLTDIGN